MKTREKVFTITLGGRTLRTITLFSPAITAPGLPTAGLTLPSTSKRKRNNRQKHVHFSLTNMEVQFDKDSTPKEISDALREESHKPTHTQS